MVRGVVGERRRVDGGVSRGSGRLKSRCCSRIRARHRRDVARPRRRRAPAAAPRWKCGCRARRRRSDSSSTAAPRRGSAAKPIPARRSRLDFKYCRHPQRFAIRPSPRGREKDIVARMTQRPHHRPLVDVPWESGARHRLRPNRLDSVKVGNVRRVSTNHAVEGRARAALARNSRPRSSSR